MNLFPLLTSYLFFFTSRRRHTRFDCDWSSDVCSSDLGVRQLVGDDPGESSNVLERVAPFGGRDRPDGRFPAVEQPEAETGEFQRQPLPAAALPPIRRGRRGTGAHRGDHPGALSGGGRSDPTTLLHNGDVPPPQRNVHVEVRSVVTGAGVARRLRLQLGAGGDLPDRHRAGTEGRAGLPQYLASALDVGLWSAHRGSRWTHQRAAAGRPGGRSRSQRSIHLRTGARNTYAISPRESQATRTPTA